MAAKQPCPREGTGQSQKRGLNNVARGSAQYTGLCAQSGGCSQPLLPEREMK